MMRVGDVLRGERSVVRPQTALDGIAEALATAGSIGNHHGVYSAGRFS
jgi:hypothetical protein